MLLSTSSWPKLLATVLAVLGFVALHEVTIFDSRYAARQAVLREPTALPAAGARLRFTATAYCKGAVTASACGPARVWRRPIKRCYRLGRSSR